MDSPDIPEPWTTAAERAAMRERHRSSFGCAGHGDIVLDHAYHTCWTCEANPEGRYCAHWPCEVARLLAENDALAGLLAAARDCVWSAAEASHLLDGFGPRQERNIDVLLHDIDAALTARGGRSETE